MFAFDASDGHRQPVHSREETLSACLQLLRQANRQIYFFAPTLDRFLLGNEQAIAFIRSFILTQRSAHLHLLVHSTRDAIKKSHGLLQLSQRLTSHISLHCCAQEDQHQQQLCLLTDDNGSLLLPDASYYKGHAATDDRAWNGQLKQKFNALWNRSEPDRQARRLTL